MGGHVAHQVYKDYNRGPFEKEIYNYHTERDLQIYLGIKKKNYHEKLIGKNNWVNMLL